jgi:hypothetical protein
LPETRDPGGRLTDFALEAPAGVEIQRDAVISADLTYRYCLTRIVGDQPRTACMVMLNPSTADALKDDNTIRRCIAFTRAWGCGTLLVANLFAFRSTDPRYLEITPDPVGRKNMDYLIGAAGRAHESGGPVVCAWGIHGAIRDQDQLVVKRMRELQIPLQCLGVTVDGFPRHPLYLTRETALQPYNGRPSTGD